MSGADALPQALAAKPRRNRKGLIALTVAALGVVYGDIGTSPLYALNLLFFHRQALPLSEANICGGLSLVVWALTVVVSINYAGFVLRADNDGEGGVFALYGLLDKFNKNGKSLLAWALLLGAGLLFGDACITPAISVLSAVEGISVATPVLDRAIIPITLVLLTVLFVFQRKGSSGIGIVFGPIMILWFLVIALLGLRQIIWNPEILRAFNPVYGIEFLRHENLRGSLIVLGAVMLVLTGGEAMYADMGHFGARPIRVGWITLAYPALILNYLGQGAFLLGHGTSTASSLFYGMLPGFMVIPMVLLATVATIIASQAMISGAFSLTAQSIALGMFPRLRIVHTHDAQIGEVYVPFVNWALYVGCVLLVIGFGSSTALGAAYGLAVNGVMVTTTVSMFFIARRYWHWSLARAGLLFGAFALIDTTFLIANSLKFFQGAFVPLSVGLVVFLVMVTWRWGRRITAAAYANKHTMTMASLIKLHQNAPYFIERTAILMVPAPTKLHAGSEHTPALLQLLWDRNGLLPRHIIFVQVVHPRVPYVHGGRCGVSVFERNDRGSVVRVELRFGFMEQPDVERALKEIEGLDGINLPADRRKWIVHVAHENLLPAAHMTWMRRVRLKLFEVLRRVSRPTYYHYGLGDDVQLSTEILPVHVS